jgi:phosphatidylglycerophosphate synthase
VSTLSATGNVAPTAIVSPRRQCAATRPAAPRPASDRYPISRWYVCPAATWVAARLAPTRIRPNALTLCGLAAATAAAVVLVTHYEAAPWAGGLVLLAWFFDRADGQLARRQGSASALGAWLDANVDELVDLGLHAAVAMAAAARWASSWPWIFLLAFYAGKYLLMYGLNTEAHFGPQRLAGSRPAAEADSAALPVLGAAPGKTVILSAAKDLRCLRTDEILRCAQNDSTHGSSGISPFAPKTVSADSARGACRRLYHLPANADVRIHLLVAALCTGWLTAELAFVALYYNLRWMVRYALVARRLGGLR